MISNKLILQKLSLVLLTALLLTACNLPSSKNVQPTEPTVLPVFQTVQAAANATLTAQADLIPSLTPSLIATETYTQLVTTPPSPTFSKPMLSVSKETNCRLGQDISFPIIGKLMPGVMAEIVALDSSMQYYYIRNPQDPQSFCWLWGYFATTVGDITGLPVFTPVPTTIPTVTATPSADFSVVQTNMDVCGTEYFFQVKIHNSGVATWSSGSIIAKDTITSTVALELTTNIFQEISGCTPIGAIQNDLSSGEDGAIHSSNFNYNPTGHAMLITIKLCSLDNLTGICLTRELTFTP